jgi:hypothetical protein
MSKSSILIVLVVILGVTGIGAWAMFAPIETPRTARVIQQKTSARVTLPPEIAKPPVNPAPAPAIARPAPPPPPAAPVARPKAKVAANTDVPLAVSVAPVSPVVPKPTSSRPRPNSTLPVDSYATAHIHPLAEWQPRKGVFGFIDTVQIEGQKSRTFDWTPVNNNDVLIITGWAGVKEFGLRMRHVLFSVCDNVVGSVEVDGARPDIAKKIHPNLVRSGWSAHLAIRHLPRCAGAKINAWGVGPKGAVIWPINREIELTYDQTIPEKAKFIAHTTPLRAANRPPYTRNQLRVTAKILNLRRCPSGKCEIVQKLKAGRYQGLVLESGKQWSLIAVNDAAGWVAKRYIKVSALPTKAPVKAPPALRPQPRVGGYILQGP